MEMIIQFIWVGDVLTAWVVVDGERVEVVGVANEEGDVPEVDWAMIEMIEMQATSLWMDEMANCPLCVTEH